jgi:hypothetical protein
MGRDPGYIAALLDSSRPSRARPTPADLLRASESTGIPFVELLEALWNIDPRRLADELTRLGVRDLRASRKGDLTADAFLERAVSPAMNVIALATTTMSAETTSAWAMPTVNALMTGAPSCTDVPRKISPTSRAGMAAAATASASAKLVTMPVCRNVASVALATPRPSGGAAPITALVLGDQKRPPTHTQHQQPGEEHRVRRVRGKLGKEHAGGCLKQQARGSRNASPDPIRERPADGPHDRLHE